MTDPQDATRDDSDVDGRLEAFLDGLLTDRERAAFAERLRAEPALRREVELQKQIDGALARQFHGVAPTWESLAAILANAAGPADVEAVLAEPGVARRATRAFWAAAALAAAAAIGWVMWSALGTPPNAGAPFFAARPLVDIYRDTVARGFEPSYECRDPKRFADTFAERQGQPLALLAMPSGMQMLGLGYMGGLSRQTTAMLCLVEGQPVMVFVDRAAADQAAAAKDGTGDLRIFREARDGLVFYEVTPLDAPRVMQLMAPASRQGDAA